ncbi:hypothetical protein CRI94_02025 [Longibacter salinarum]|uniref:BACON domain-containing protein n=1 Tax=Longibacter salinarum TaxID=1850348 RepID=A0A2A8D2A9_9BACT|nr:hypothetical protein CRI94_02025 [Longibacter salinarum]
MILTSGEKKDTVRVTKEVPRPLLHLSTTSFHLDELRRSDSLTIESEYGHEIPWTIQHKPKWITVHQSDSTSVTASMSMSFTVDESLLPYGSDNSNQIDIR